MNSSSTSFLFFTLATIIFGLVAPATAEDTNTGCTPTADYCWSCSSTTNATTTSKLNLNALLSSLSSNNQTNYGFYNSSLGTGTNKVNVIAMCRGDIAQNDCRSCYNNASLILSQNCYNKPQAILWAERCTIRYSNISLFGIEEDKPALYLTSPNNASNTEEFKLVRNPLLETLRAKAAPGDSMKKFAAGHALVQTNQTIYATVQCSPDLDKQNCSDCLEEAISDISKCCDGVDGARVLKPSCNLRFESNRFYESSADSLVNPPAPQPLPATPPPLSATPSPLPATPPPLSATPSPLPATPPPLPATPPPLPATPPPPATQGNNTSNITTRVSPSLFFQMLLSLLCLSSALF